MAPKVYAYTERYERPVLDCEGLFFVMRYSFFEEIRIADRADFLDRIKQERETGARVITTRLPWYVRRKSRVHENKRDGTKENIIFREAFETVGLIGSG